MPIRAPHLHVPLTLSGSQLVYDEQDSDAELEACAFAILNTRLGDRLDLPEFGTTDQAHQQGGADLDELARVTAMWDERVDLSAMREGGVLADILDRVRIGIRGE